MKTQKYRTTSARHQKGKPLRQWIARCSTSGSVRTETTTKMQSLALMALALKRVRSRCPWRTARIRRCVSSTSACLKEKFCNISYCTVAGKPAVSVATEASKSGYEIAPSSGKEFQENDSVEVLEGDSTRRAPCHYWLLVDRFVVNGLLQGYAAD
jgi:hypothetical protein